ncbi:polysaccharide pyruvyl transferase family protein [Avibacterium avium]|uniref:polysaccharide pyruvyl transferase family protein n=1 Tax=Avibacterium avium TaxID=751 RepID=UPI003BF8D6A5
MIRKLLRNYPVIYSIMREIHIFLHVLANLYNHRKLGIQYKKLLKNHPINKKKIWYFCIPIHNNLGDYAQYYCISKLLTENYPDLPIVEIPTSPIKYDYCNFFQELKKHVGKSDLIIFQSGYTSSDLHDDEAVHRKIVSSFKENKIVFFPQTVKYSKRSELLKTANIYNEHGNILFLARDMVSYDTAKKWFKDIKVLLYPDVVTSLIGINTFNNSNIDEKKGILVCIRSDSEKFFSNREIRDIVSDLENHHKIEWLDTTLTKGKACNDDVLEQYIEKFSSKKLIITDRFHGTIFSLIAKTPVIVLKSVDHKVSEGAKWFIDRFPSYIKSFDNLSECETFIKNKISEDSSLEEIYPYFKEQYYDKLFELINKN